MSNYEDLNWRVEVSLKRSFIGMSRPFATVDALALAVLWPKLTVIGETKLIGWTVGNTSYNRCQVNIAPDGYGFVTQDEDGATIAEAVTRAWLAVAERKEGKT